MIVCTTEAAREGEAAGARPPLVLELNLKICERKRFPTPRVAASQPVRLGAPPFTSVLVVRQFLDISRCVTDDHAFAVRLPGLIRGSRPT